MVMKDYLNRGKKYLILAAAMLLCLCITIPVFAEEEAKQIVIRESASLGPDTVGFLAELPEAVSGSYDVYRAVQDPAAGGQLEKIDSVLLTGTWTSDGTYWRKSGVNGKITCYAQDSELEGEVIFCDTGLSLGRVYYYQIVLNDTWSEMTVSSNIISAQTELAVPELLKCYASSNTTVKISWQKSSKAQGYEIFRKSGGKWTRVKTIKKGSATSVTLKKQTSGKTYQYRIRAYRKVNGEKVYSAYSMACKVKLKNPTVKGTYSSGSVYGPSLSSSELADVRRVVQSFKDNFIRSGMSDYEKAWAAFSYIRANCDYAWRGWQYNRANTAWGALVYGEAQCSGYARGMKALCDAIGVPCRYVHANSKAVNPSHQWNQVKIGGKWYVLDAQGGFFLVGSQTWKKSMGMYWNESGLPKVNKTDHPKGGFVSSEM